MQTIRGRKALITGAASGIGRALAINLAREGANLYLIDIDQKRLDLVIAEVNQIGGEAIGRRCDLADSQQISAAVQHLLRHWGAIDILVNNAGVGYYGTTLKMTADQWDHLLGINLLAPIQFTRELLPKLLASPDPHILNIASICGLVAGGRATAYHVSKFGLVGLSEALRAEYGRQGLGVTVVCPGSVRTEFFESAENGDVKRPMPIPPGWISATPQQVADKAIRAMYEDKALVLVTPLAYLLYYTKRIAPWFLNGIQRIGRRRRMKKRLAKIQSVERISDDERSLQIDVKKDRAA